MTVSPPLIWSAGHGWHLRAGPLLLSHYRPPSRAPWLDEASLRLHDCEHEGGCYDPNYELFVGWAVRWPRCSFGFVSGSRTARGARALQVRRLARDQRVRQRTQLSRALGMAPLSSPPSESDGWSR